MNRVTKAAGYTLAFLMTPLVLATFVGMDYGARKLVSITGIKVTPWYTGAEVVRKVGHGRYETRIHRPVFDGLLWERKQGFVQVDWAPDQSIPTRIDEEVDFDGDGIADFRVQLESAENAATIIPLDRRVLSLEGTYRLENARSVRVTLTK